MQIDVFRWTVSVFGKALATFVILVGFTAYFINMSDDFPGVGADFYYENVSRHSFPMSAQVPRTEGAAAWSVATGLNIDEWKAPPLPIQQTALSVMVREEHSAISSEWESAIAAGAKTIILSLALLFVCGHRFWWL